MTNSEFYNCINLKKDGVVNLKTDSEFMHGYTLGLLHGKDTKFCIHNVYVNEGSPEEVNFQTRKRTLSIWQLLVTVGY
jgi:tRNA (guanine-N7-)-methyltransferase